MRHSLRGQTMVLFALTLLLLTLMVCMTLSIGIKAKEKMELETAADAAAYSQAVATARAFNSISLMNRALMSHMVAMAGVESLISWASFYRGALNMAHDNYNPSKLQYEGIAASNCPCAPTNAACERLCNCARQALQDIEDTQSQLKDADNEAEQIFQGLDSAAGLEARSLQLSSISEQQKDTIDRLRDADLLSDKPRIAQAIADEVNRNGLFGAELSALGAAEVNEEEVGGGDTNIGSCGDSRLGAACRRRNAGMKNHFIWAAMGSRGHGFVTGRAGGKDLIESKLLQYVPRNELLTVENEGSAYFAELSSVPKHAQKPAGNEAAWGDDHGDIGVDFLRNQPPCPPGIPTTRRAFAHVRSDDLNQNNDAHVWYGGQDDDGRKNDHTMGDCTLCPGMWPPHMDYNYGKLSPSELDNLYGQPKTYAIMQRDLGVRQAGGADPWNLFFNFRFTPDSDGEFDNRGIRLRDGTDISKAVALSAGLAYYHRGGDRQRWKEPPNFLNPFWRATLVSATMDTPDNNPDTTQLEKALESASPFAREAAAALSSQGYMAW